MKIIRKILSHSILIFFIAGITYSFLNWTEVKPIALELKNNISQWVTNANDSLFPNNNAVVANQTSSVDHSDITQQATVVENEAITNVTAINDTTATDLTTEFTNSAKAIESVNSKQIADIPQITNTNQVSNLSQQINNAQIEQENIFKPAAEAIVTETVNVTDSSNLSEVTETTEVVETVEITEADAVTKIAEITDTTVVDNTTEAVETIEPTQTELMTKNTVVPENAEATITADAVALTETVELLTESATDDVSKSTNNTPSQNTNALSVEHKAKNKVFSPRIDIKKTLYMARSAFWQKDYISANEFYMSIIQTKPKSPDIFGEIGNFYYSLGHWDQAASAYYEAAIRLNSQGQQQKILHLIRILEGLAPGMAKMLKQRNVDFTIASSDER